MPCVAGRGSRPHPRQARLPRARVGGHRGELPGHAGPLQPRHGQPGNKRALQCCDDADIIFGGGAYYYCLSLLKVFLLLNNFNKKKWNALIASRRLYPNDVSST